jgi:predicted O-methyltransferase YrrM
MLSGHIQGKLLAQISCMIRPQHILEIGTYTGYATLCLAEGLTEDGELHTIERNDELHEAAKAFMARSPHAGKIKMHTGDALQIIPALCTTFDVVYIDGDKREYSAYYHAVFDKVRIGGFILADNVLWNGKVVNTSAAADAQTQGIKTFNALVQADPRVENVLLPLRDGFTIIRKINTAITQS